MPESKRSYNQFCSVARALDVLGERWTLLIIRDLLLGPWRYSDLLSRLKGITTNLLAKRLASLEELGLIRKQAQSSIGSPHVYELTDMGRNLESTILSLGQFGFQYMASGPGPKDQMDIGWGLLVLKLRYRGKHQGVVTLRLGVGEKIPPVVYQVRYSPEYVDIRHGQTWASDVVVNMSLVDYRQMAFQGVLVSTLKNKIKLQGSDQIWREFMASFGFPE